MKKSMMVLMIIGCIVAISAQAAQRTVIYEHFTEDECLYCAQVSSVIDSFRSAHSRSEVAVISFSTNGSDPIPDGLNRLDVYGLETTPAVAGDGLDNLEPMPIDQSALENHYNSRRNVSSPVSIEVFQESDTQYRIFLSAESAFSGSLVAVAYEDIEHDGHRYQCWGRQFLTPYYGESISMNAGETREITKNVSIQGGWLASNMGVVAYVQTQTKDSSRRFRAYEVFQAADSRAEHTNPTPTPPLETPTPCATATPSTSDFSQTLDLNQSMFHAGDRFVLEINSKNAGASPFTVDQYLVLQVLDLYFFWPTWSNELGFDVRTYAAGYDDLETILDFYWPSGAGSFSPIYFWLVATLPDTFDLACTPDTLEFGYAE